MSSTSKSQKRKNKKKYFQSTKKLKCGVLESGLKGFLISCNDEHRCVKEAYNLLNEFADEIYGPEFQNENECSDDLDVDEQLAKEISAFKTNRRRFQQLSTKVKGIIFISTTVPDPILLVDKVFDSVIKTGKRKARFILKLKPVSITCKAYETEICKAVEDALSQSSIENKNEELTYKVESKIRNNDNITSSHIIWYVRDSLKKVAPKWTACISNPQIIISFYVLRTTCCISVLNKYDEYKKYNLSEVATSSASCGDSNQVSVIIPSNQNGNIEEQIPENVQ